MRRFLLIALLGLAVVPSAGAATLLGVLGNADHFRAHTGQESRVVHLIYGWNQVPRGLVGEIPLVGFGTEGGWPNLRELITPRDVALGKGDDYLVALNRAFSEHEGREYARPFGEMNGHWNAYCAFTKDGRPKGPAHTTAWFKKAFARVYLIVHGPPDVNARLRRLGLPPVTAELSANPLPDTRVIWNPQGYGSPDLPGNSAAAYYPGDAYVDVVGNDVYNIRGKAEWAAADALYRAYPQKPYSFPEWANWGLDDPAFIKRMADFVRTHKRVELIAYYARGPEFELANKPKTRAAYRKYILPLGR